MLAQHKGHFIQTNTYYAHTHSQTQTNPHVTTNTVGRLDTHTLPSYNKGIEQNSRGPGGTGSRGAMFRGRNSFRGRLVGGRKLFEFGAQKKGGTAQPGVGFPSRWPGFFRGGLTSLLLLDKYFWLTSFGGECVGAMWGCGWGGLWVCQVVGVITGGDATRVVVAWVCWGLWLVSLIGVAHFMLGYCFWACLVGFGCGSVMIGVTPIIGCVWLTM